MKNTIFAILILFVSIYVSNCEKDNSLVNTTKNAEIINFIPEKCYCCWGWVIKVGNDTIKADKLPDPDIVGYEINSPVKVIIEIGEKTADCSSGYDYYEINKLILNN